MEMEYLKLHSINRKLLFSSYLKKSFFLFNHQKLGHLCNIDQNNFIVKLAQKQPLSD